MTTTAIKTQALQQLLTAGLAGDQHAYGRFLEEVSRYLRRIVARRIPASDVEDVLQEILVSLHKARHTYDGKRSVLPWVTAIARFRMTDYLRRYYANRQAAYADIADFENSLSEPVTESSEIGESIEQEVRKLPERQQRILYLIHTEGCTAREVGAKLGMKESAVKVAAHRAYKKIKQELAS